jgi:hypothetical protein
MSEKNQIHIIEWIWQGIVELVNINLNLCCGKDREE